MNLKFKMPENLYEKFKDLQIAILGVCIAIGIIFASVVSTTNLSKDNISVTGSAYEIVKSDSANWTFSIKAKAPTKAQAYKIVKGQIPTVKKYLLSQGFTEDQIEIKLANGYETYKTNPVNGYQTNVVEYYNYIQPIKVSSNDVAKIDELTKSYEVLLEQGLNISSEEQPQYHYSKLADLKGTIKWAEILEGTKKTLDIVNQAIINVNPKLVIIDSIQTMYSDEITATAGSVSQVREITRTSYESM